MLFLGDLDACIITGFRSPTFVVVQAPTFPVLEEIFPFLAISSYIGKVAAGTTTMVGDQNPVMTPASKAPKSSIITCKNN